jgi:hypothetical protein
MLQKIYYSRKNMAEHVNNIANYVKYQLKLRSKIFQVYSVAMNEAQVLNNCLSYNVYLCL